MHRRDVLKALIAFGGLQALSLPAAAKTAPGRFLILIELKGGHDDLYSFPLIGNPLFAKLRPTLAVPTNEILGLSGKRGLHANLASLIDPWKTGELAFVQGLSAGTPEYSHFAAGQRWETGVVDQPDERLGWMARAWQEGRVMPVAGEFDAAVLGFNPGVLAGGSLRVLEINGPDVIGDTPMLDAADIGPGNPTLEHLRRVMRDWGTTRQLLIDAARRMPAPASAFTQRASGRALITVAALMHADEPPAIYKLTIDGFDSHVGQRDRYRKLWGPLVQDLLSLRSLLQRSGLWQRTTVATYSEFGRRVAENGGGTDHGGASTQLLMGGAVRGGFYGELPNLSDLNGGNVRGTMDFRRYYNSLWMEALGGKQAAFDPDRYAPLGLVG